MIAKNLGNHKYKLTPAAGVENRLRQPKVLSCILLALRSFLFSCFSCLFLFNLFLHCSTCLALRAVVQNSRLYSVQNTVLWYSVLLYSPFPNDVANTAADCYKLYCYILDCCILFCCVLDCCILYCCILDSSGRLWSSHWKWRINTRFSGHSVW